MHIKPRVHTDRFRLKLRHPLLWAVLLVAAPAGSASADRDEFREFMGRDLVAAGNQVTISGDNLGGAFAAGETVELASPTREDAILAGRYVRVRALVGDDAYLAGELVDVDAPVTGRIVAAGETVSLNSGAETGGGVRLFGRRVEVAGTVGGDAWIVAETVRLSGKFSGDVTVSARNVDVAPNARFDGMLITRAPKEPAVPQTAVPSDRWRYEKWKPPEWEGGWSPWQFAGVIFGAILLFPLSFLVTGAILLAIAGNTMDRIATTGAERPAASIGGGLIVLAVWGVAALLLLFTIIGAPLGVLLGLALPLLIMLGYVAGALVLALGAWRSLGKAPLGGLGRFGLLAVSLFVLSIVGLIPVIGFIAGLLVTLAGLGAAFIVLREDRPGSGHHRTVGI